jgi:hypothetical protein
MSLLLYFPFSALQFFSISFPSFARTILFAFSSFLLKVPSLHFLLLFLFSSSLFSPFFFNFLLPVSCSLFCSFLLYFFAPLPCLPIILFFLWIFVFFHLLHILPSLLLSLLTLTISLSRCERGMCEVKLVDMYNNLAEIKCISGLQWASMLLYV